MMNGFAAAPKLLYSADYYKDKKNGWKTEDVLKKVGKAKKTVLLIKTDRGQVLGGYTDINFAQVVNSKSKAVENQHKSFVFFQEKGKFLRWNNVVKSGTAELEYWPNGKGNPRYWGSTLVWNSGLFFVSECWKNHVYFGDLMSRYKGANYKFYKHFVPA